MENTPRAPRLTWLLSPALALVSGCTANRAISPGSTPLPVYGAREAVVAPPPSEGPSLLHGHDRGSWAPIVIGVPINGVEHQPTYRLPYERMETVRQRGNYPTAITALETGSSHTAEAWGEAGAGVLASAAGLVVAPIRMLFLQRPWETSRGPGMDHERVSAPAPPDDPGRWFVPGPAPQDAAPAGEAPQP